ncbi:MAG: septum site-determining protein Ssd [Mycobacteriaceae bacterium]
MSPAAATPALALLTPGPLREELLRLAAAAGCELDLCTAVTEARVPWARAPLVVLDPDAAARCAAAGLPRREGVLVLDQPGAHGSSSAQTWRAAVAVGAEHVVQLPDGEAFLVGALGERAERADEGGRVLAVLGARGGAGASVLAAAVAGAAAEVGRRALLVDCDPLGGGLDLVLGVEEATGLRWSGVALTGGRVTAAALHEALPGDGGLLTVLSCGRDEVAPSPDAVAAVLDAGRRAGDVVVCDLPRSLGPAALAVLDRADVTVLVVPAEVRACAAAARVVAATGARGDGLRIVVRGPAPGGLRSVDVSRALGLPVLATSRPRPRLAELLERGGLPHRGPLPNLADAVLAALTASTSRPLRSAA